MAPKLCARCSFFLQCSRSWPGCVAQVPFGRTATLDFAPNVDYNYGVITLHLTIVLILDLRSNRRKGLEPWIMPINMTSSSAHLPRDYARGESFICIFIFCAEMSRGVYLCMRYIYIYNLAPGDRIAIISNADPPTITCTQVLKKIEININKLKKPSVPF